MTYININCSSIKPTRNYIEENWVHSNQTNFFKKQILARATFLVLAPSSLIIGAVDTIVGLGAAIGSLCTLGKHKPIFEAAISHLASSDKLVALPYLNILQTINPAATLMGDLSNEPEEIRSLAESRGFVPAMISADGNGFITDRAIHSLKTIAKSCYNSENFLKRHVSSRLTYVLLAISCVVTRAVDGIIGVAAAALSILSMGQFISLNNLAYRSLQTTGIISDLFYCTIKFVNPWTGLS